MASLLRLVGMRRLLYIPCESTVHLWTLELDAGKVCGLLSIRCRDTRCHRHYLANSRHHQPPRRESNSTCGTNYAAAPTSTTLAPTAKQVSVAGRTYSHLPGTDESRPHPTHSPTGNGQDRHPDAHGARNQVANGGRDQQGQDSRPCRHRHGLRQEQVGGRNRGRRALYTTTPVLFGPCCVASLGAPCFVFVSAVCFFVVRYI